MFYLQTYLVWKTWRYIMNKPWFYRSGFDIIFVTLLNRKTWKHRYSNLFLRKKAQIIQITWSEVANFNGRLIRMDAILKLTSFFLSLEREGLDDIPLDVRIALLFSYIPSCISINTSVAEPTDFSVYLPIWRLISRNTESREISTDFSI